MIYKFNLLIIFDSPDLQIPYLNEQVYQLIGIKKSCLALKEQAQRSKPKILLSLIREALKKRGR